MSKFLAKGLLVLVGFSLQFSFFGSSVMAAIALVCAIILSGLADAIDTSHKGVRIIYELILVAALVMCVFIKEMSVYCPVIVYAIVEENSIYLYPLAVASLAGIIVVSGIAIAAVVFAISLVAALICYLVKAIAKLNENQHILRDSSVEKEMLIERSNRILRESQDANVYAATLKERNRIAREIHDNVGHMLTRSILQTGAIRTINKNEALDKPLLDLSDTLNQAMVSIRQSVHDLHDESINLKSAIEEILVSAGDMKTVLEYDMSSDIGKDIKYCFLAIIKEAVNNSLKYSNGDTIMVVSREHPGFYQLMVNDNGQVEHYDVDNGIGLTNIRNRVDALGGRLKISTDGGFKILITIMKR